MKNRITTLLICLSLLIVFSTIGGLHIFQTKVNAFNPQPDPPGYGLVGITNGQTIRINVVNTLQLPAADSPPDPCRVVLTFRNADGDLFRHPNGTPVRVIELLQPGRSASVDLIANEFIRSADQTGRIQLRPVAQVQQADPIGDTRSPPDPCIPSVEVFNSLNGRTQFMVPAMPVVARSLVQQ